MKHLRSKDVKVALVFGNDEHRVVCLHSNNLQKTFPAIKSETYFICCCC